MMPSPAAIAAIRRRYLGMATSIALLDLALMMVFCVISGFWDGLWLTATPGIVLLLGVNWFVARRRFEPIRRFLAGEIPFDDVQRRLTQLPLLTARMVGLLAFCAWLFRLSIPWWAVHAGILYEKPTLIDFATTVVLVAVFYFIFTYFVVSDYLAQLCTFIFRHTGQTLGLFFGSYRIKLVAALLVVSVVPLATIVVDLYSYSGARQQAEILIDEASALLGLAISGYFISRSLLGPLGILSNAMSKVAAGDLDIRVAVTSNDQVGEVTGQFNTMVAGLRERERIRETFGRYVDESVAATILGRQGDGALAGEIGEATILFTDIAGFTTIAEYLQPGELVAALNEYLETVLEPIQRHGGIVNTFIGDGLFASFNMPLGCADHAAAAVAAAIDIQRAVNSRTFGDQGVALATRIGISTGRVIGGSVGAGQRLSFTLLGDTVNLAARLEELNKQHGTRILVSEETRTACGERFAFKPLGRIPVRGRSEPVDVYSIDPNGQDPA